MPSSAQIAEVFEQAADLLESEKIGWCQRNLAIRAKDSDEVISVCALGAIQYVTVSFFQESLLGDTINLYIQSINTLVDRLGGSVPNWNDDIVTDKQQVIDAFKEIAKDLHNEG